MRKACDYSCILYTLQQVFGCFILNIRAELSGFLQVLENKDIGSKVDHILLPTPKGQPQQFVQIIKSWSHHIPCKWTHTYTIFIK